MPTPAEPPEIPEERAPTRPLVRVTTLGVTFVAATIILLAAGAWFASSKANQRTQQTAIATSMLHTSLRALWIQHSGRIEQPPDPPDQAVFAEGYLWNDGFALRIDSAGAATVTTVPRNALTDLEQRAALLLAQHGDSFAHGVLGGSPRSIRIRLGDSTLEYSWEEWVRHEVESLDQFWNWSDTMLQSNSRPLRDDPEVHEDIIQRLRALGDTYTISLLAEKHTP